MNDVLFSPDGLFVCHTPTLGWEYNPYDRGGTLVLTENLFGKWNHTLYSMSLPDYVAFHNTWIADNQKALESLKTRRPRAMVPAGQRESG